VENHTTEGVKKRDQWFLTDSQINPNIVGFASPFSIDLTGEVEFKIQSPQNYKLEIFRLGYYHHPDPEYRGGGARLIETWGDKLGPSNQGAACRRTNSYNGSSACINPATNDHWTADCLNWDTVASFSPPAGVPSGFYVARVTTLGTNPTGQLIPFVVRDDSRTSDVLAQTPDVTWQAYNLWTDDPLHPLCGIGAFYSPDADAYGGVITRASYNRPFNRTPNNYDTVYGFSRFFDNTYPIIRWLERFGVDVSYITGLEVAHDYTDRTIETTLLRHSNPTKRRLFLTMGHDEYWSQEQRNNIERARSVGVHMAFLTGNDMFWKVGWDFSDDQVDALCVKQSNKIPHVGVTQSNFTGLWQDGRYIPSTNLADAKGPENGTTGLISAAYSGRHGEVLLSPEEGNMRFWRNTPFAGSGTRNLDMTLPAHLHSTIGHEWDQDLDNGSRPSGIFHLSSTPMIADASLNFGRGDYIRGAEYSTHSLTMFGDSTSTTDSVVFHAGSIEFAGVLDGFRRNPITFVEDETSIAAQQGLLNLFADMRLTQPEWDPDEINWMEPWAPLWSGPPTSLPTIMTDICSIPTIQVNQRVKILGFAGFGSTTSTTGLHIAAVEVSFGDGVWHTAVGRETWYYWWTPSYSGNYTVQCRAIDDLGRVGDPVSSPTVTVIPVSGYCTSSICYQDLWGGSIPPYTQTDPAEVELGARFTPSVDGFVYGIRFYRRQNDTGAHYVNLWRLVISDAVPSQERLTLLASAPLTAVAPGPGSWVSVMFRAPVRVLAGGIYVAAFHTESGFSYTGSGPSSPAPFLGYLGPRYRYIPRDSNDFYLREPDASAPVDYAWGYYYPVEPMFRPTAAIQNSFWPESGVSPMKANWAPQAWKLFGHEFHTDIPGYITGCRFFNLDTTELFKVSLWGSSETTPLVTATEITAVAGWREVPFTQAIHIDVPTALDPHRYIMTYEFTSGTQTRRFASTDDYFRDNDNNPVVSWPLKAVWGWLSTQPNHRPKLANLYDTRSRSCLFIDVLFRTAEGPPVISSCSGG
jgi:hypothetical protein